MHQASLGNQVFMNYGPSNFFRRNGQLGRQNAPQFSTKLLIGDAGEREKGKENMA